MKCIVVFLLGVIAAGLQAGTPLEVHLNKIVAKLELEKPVCGMWVSALHPANAVGLVERNGYPRHAESLNQAMIDYILIDMEHQPYDITALRDFLLALNSKREVLIKGNLQPNIAVLVRIPAEGDQPTHAMIKQVLDIGVHGVVVPHVRTAQEARRIVAACRYVQQPNAPYPEPAGTRGASPWLASYLWGLTLPDYVRRADLWPLNPEGDLLAVVMIEDQTGLDNIDEIAAVPGIGAVIFGPYDYSFYAGHPGETGHEKVLQGWQTAKAACDRAGVPLVGFANPDNVVQLLRDGYRMLLFGHDVRNNGAVPAVLEKVQKEAYSTYP